MSWDGQLDLWDIRISCWLRECRTILGLLRTCQSSLLLWLTMRPIPLILLLWFALTLIWITTIAPKPFSIAIERIRIRPLLTRILLSYRLRNPRWCTWLPFSKFGVVDFPFNFHEYLFFNSKLPPILMGNCCGAWVFQTQPAFGLIFLAPNFRLLKGSEASID